MWKDIVSIARVKFLQPSEDVEVVVAAVEGDAQNLRTRKKRKEDF